MMTKALLEDLKRHWLGDWMPHCPCCGCIDIDYLIFLDDDGFTLRCDDCGHLFVETDMEDEP